MPIFEYACQGCDNKFEDLVFNSSKHVTCPKCGGDKLRKLISVFSSSSGESFQDFGSSAPQEGACGYCGSTERRCDA